MPAAARHRLTRRRLLAAFGVGTTGLALVGCGGAGSESSSRRGNLPPAVDYSARFAAFEPADEPNGDLAKVTWPDWLDRFDPEVKRLYEFHVVNGDLMRWMPCFCGCNAGDGHRNNRDCYIEAVNLDGSVVFDSMAPT